MDPSSANDEVHAPSAPPNAIEVNLCSKLDLYVLIWKLFYSRMHLLALLNPKIALQPRRDFRTPRSHLLESILTIGTGLTPIRLAGGWHVLTIVLTLDQEKVQKHVALTLEPFSLLTLAAFITIIASPRLFILTVLLSAHRSSSVFQDVR